MLSLKRPRAFTLIELLVVIAIISALISLLLPSLGRARDQARIVKCLGNNRQIVLATTQYNNDFKGYFPTLNPTPTALLFPYLNYNTQSINNRSHLFYCPASSGWEENYASGTPDTWAQGASYLYYGGVQSYGYNLGLMTHPVTGQKYLVALFGIGADVFSTAQVDKLRFPDSTLWSADYSSMTFDRFIGTQGLSAYRHGPVPELPPGYNYDKYYLKTGATGFVTGFTDGHAAFVKWDDYRNWSYTPGGFPNGQPFALY